MKLLLTMIATLALLPCGKASAAVVKPAETAATGGPSIRVAIHCECDKTGRDYLQAVRAEMAQHPEYTVVDETATGDVVRIAISSHTEASGGSAITVVSRHAGSSSTQTVERSCDKIGIDDVARGTVKNLPEIL